MPTVKHGMMMAPEPEFRLREATQVMPIEAATSIVEGALQRWQAATAAAAQRRHEQLLDEFPDTAAPAVYWHSAANSTFKDFFTWGHDHDFGHGVMRPGAMGPRHIEIASEAISQGMLPPDLKGLTVLDVGCWSGGDLLILAGLGADVVALDEHTVSAESARRLCALVDCPAQIVTGSLFRDREDWRQRFDIVYCAGVIYHVTDPLLFLRICFAYLKPGVQIVVETKAYCSEGSFCQYAGTLEKGWNWYSPTREALGRWLVDAGFPAEETRVCERPIGRLLAASVKTRQCPLPESAGFSRPGSWLEAEV